MTPSQQPKEQLVYSSIPWKICRQDAGMGEHDYAVFLNYVFFCRTEHSQTAHEIINAIRSRPSPAPAPEHTIEYQIHRLSQKLIYGKCIPDSDCSKCILCDNAGGCLAESSFQVTEAARKAREDVLGKVIPTLGKAIQTDVSDNDYVMIEDLESTLDALRQEP